MVDKAKIDRATFDRLFGSTLDAIRKNDFGRIFKDVVGSHRGSRAVSVWATGTGYGLNEMSIDTGYTVERNGVLRFSQGEGCLELSIYFSPDDEQVGVVELATKGGVDVPFDDIDKHVVTVAKAFDHVLRDQLPSARLVPPPTVPFPLWAMTLGDRPGLSVAWSQDLAAMATPPQAVASNRANGDSADHGRGGDVAELWSQLRTLIDQQNPG